ncbi:penicillin amidase [Micromonospora sp. Llam0]|nr:penicillin amidase [Micromonospora sp. Llam0]
MTARYAVGRSGRVHRDGYGVPHLWAADVDDLAYLQGHTAATDRAWQIEVERWRSEGALASRLGPAEVGWDRFARRVRLDDTAERCFHRLDPATRRWVGAYVDGVNHGLAEGAGAAPEFAATGTTAGSWQPWTPLGVFLVQHVLFGTFGSKLWRAHVTATLGPAAVDLFAMEPPASSGSNAWAVTGRHSGTGSPVIAGDPHRILELPNVYQQVQLTCPEFDVFGFAFPGVPGLPHFGHAGEVAWAITNAMADYQDLYREQLRRVDGQVLVRQADGWAPVPAHTELIEVRDADPVPVEVIETPRGPVIDVDRRTGEAISLRTPSRVGGALGFDALLPLLRARRVGDVERALRHWVEPVNSVLVADRSGAVRRLVAGRVPVRDDRCRQVPVPGWAPRYTWRPGYTALPAAEVSDLVVNANDRRGGDTADLGVDFAPPHRARRIRQLLDSGAAPESVHMDTLVPTAGLRRLLRGLDLTDQPGPVRQLREKLLGWDGRMAADSADAGLFAAWRAALVHRLSAEPCLRPLHAEPGFDELFAPWTDPVGRIGLALDRLIDGLPRLGGDPGRCAVAALVEVADGPPPGRWGDRHLLHPVRVLPGAADPATDALGGPVPLDGDTGSVLATSSVPGVSDVCWRGPVARYVWDLADPAASRWVVPFGASGRPGDRHFADQLPRWTAGQLVPVSPVQWTSGPGGTARPSVYVEQLPGIGRFSLLVLDPTEDLDLLYGWVTEPRARFWGMTGHTREQVGDVYRFLDGLDSHHAYLMTVDDEPVGIFQTYLPAEDPLGEHYPVRDGDIGIHLFLAPARRPVAGFTGAVAAAFTRYLFADPGRRRIVIEPDVRNDRALRRWKRLGFEFDVELTLADKRAQLAFLTRAAFTVRQATGGVPSTGDRR